MLIYMPAYADKHDGYNSTKRSIIWNDSHQILSGETSLERYPCRDSWRNTNYF